MQDPHFEVIPVIDLLNGRAVHAIAGRRAHYRPLESTLHPGSDIVSLARALRESLNVRTLYLADLDAIGGATSSVALYREIIDSNVNLWIDAGVRDGHSLAALGALEGDRSTIVAGLETLSGPDALRAIVTMAGPARVVFSLDLIDGRPKTDSQAPWMAADPLALVDAAVDCGVRRLLVLDLAHVGTSRGLGTLALIQQIRARHPALAITAGGGISRLDEIVELRDAGLKSVLVGSAIHDGRIDARALEALERA